MKTYKIGIAGLCHDHVWGELNAWKATGRAELVAAGDVNEPLRARVKEMFPDIRLYNSWEEMIATENDLDIVQGALENCYHADVAEAAAAKGFHLLFEKPMAATGAQADRMLAATQKAGVKLMINWPTAWNPAYQEMVRLLKDGELGTVRYFKYRSAHNGPKEIGCDPHFWQWLYDGEKNGAGAFMDYCCYGAAMCAYILGLPEKVTGLRGVLAKDYPLPDDNAIIVMQYKHAMGVAEASWTQVTGYVNGNPVAYGSEGAVCVSKGNLVFLRPGKGEEVITPPATVAPHRSAPEYFLHCLDNNLPIEGICSAENGRDAQAILQAGLDSCDTGNVQVPKGKFAL
jgi:predicted dehydrogenase